MRALQKEEGEKMRYACRLSANDHPEMGGQYAIYKEGFGTKGEIMYLSPTEFGRIYRDMTAAYKADFGHYGPIRRPTETRTQYGFEEDREGNTLPEDGFPRMTTEGAEILREGLNGDFARWRVAIGNHPYELPLTEVRNVMICATDTGDHFVAKWWTGHHYPKTTKSEIVMPWFVFDQIDEAYRDGHKIVLTRSDDYWAHLPILLDGYGECAG